jgi:preprotein translocase subunit SecF
MGYHESVFSKVDYRILIFITPLIGLLLIPAAINIPLGIDFTGGTELQVLTERSITEQQISSALSDCTTSNTLNIRVGELDGKTSAIIRTKDVMTKECVHSGFSGLGFTEEELARVLPSTFRPELGKILIEQGSNIVLIAGILMTLIVFIVFRSVVPSLAVIQAAVFDILIAMGLLSLFGFELNLAGVAAFLMLIGYSVDTDIMLTSKILRQTGKTFAERANEAFTTGITMTGTTLGAMSAIFIVTSFVQMETVSQIAAVILAGLVADIPTTWFTNLAILKWHSERPKKGSSRFKFSLFRQ